jgi:hypothetical protein
MSSYLRSLLGIVCLTTVGCGAVDDVTSEEAVSELSAPLYKDPSRGATSGCTGAATDFMGPVTNGHMEGSLCCGEARCTDTDVCADTTSSHEACVDCDYVSCTATKVTPLGSTLPDLPSQLP